MGNRFVLLGLACVLSTILWFARKDSPTDDGSDAGMRGRADPRRVEATEAISGIPFLFVENRGQVPDPAVRFVSPVSGGHVAVTETGLLHVLCPEGEGRPIESHLLRFGEDRGAARVTCQQPLQTRFHFIQGQADGTVARSAPTCGRVVVEQAYPGVDLVLYGEGKRLEYDCVVAPGVDPARIRLTLEGGDGLRLDPDGSLVVDTGSGQVVHRPPRRLPDARRPQGGGSGPIRPARCTTRGIRRRAV